MTARLCAFCGEPLDGKACRGMHARCYAKARQAGLLPRLRPLVRRDPDPASDPLNTLVDAIVRRRSA